MEKNLIPWSWYHSQHAHRWVDTISAQSQPHNQHSWLEEVRAAEKQPNSSNLICEFAAYIYKKKKCAVLNNYTVLHNPAHSLNTLRCRWSVCPPVFADKYTSYSKKMFLQIKFFFKRFYPPTQTMNVCVHKQKKIDIPIAGHLCPEGFSWWKRRSRWRCCGCCCTSSACLFLL